MDCEAASRYFLPIACRRHGRATSIVRRRLFLAAVVLFGAVVSLLLPVCRLCWHTLRIFTRVFPVDTCASTRYRDGVRFVSCPCTIPRLQVMGGLSISAAHICCALSACNFTVSRLRDCQPRALVTWFPIVRDRITDYVLCNVYMWRRLACADCCGVSACLVYVAHYSAACCMCQ